MKQKLEAIPVKEINVLSIIKYKEVHAEYGRAEFTFCPVFKRGYLHKLWIYRKQQGYAEGFVFNVSKEYPRINQFAIESWMHKTEHPKIWQNGWCKEHKCVLFDVYVPRSTSRIVFRFMSDCMSILMEDES